MKTNNSFTANFSIGTSYNGKIELIFDVGEKCVLAEAKRDTGELLFDSDYFSHPNYLGEYFEKITNHNGVVYGLNYLGKYIEGYWSGKKQISRIDIPNRFSNEKWNNSSVFAVIGSNVVLVTKKNPSILFYDFELSSITNEIQLKAESIIDGDVDVDNEKIVLLVDNGQRIIIYNLKSNLCDDVICDVKLHRIFASDTKIFGLTKDNEVAYFDDNVEVVKKRKVDFQVNEIVSCKGVTIFLGDDIYFSHSYDDEIKHIDYPNMVEITVPIEWIKFIAPFEDEKNYYFPPRVLSHMLVVSKETGLMSWEIFSYYEGAEYWKMCMYANNNLFIEKNSNLPEFLEFVLHN